MSTTSTLNDDKSLKRRPNTSANEFDDEKTTNHTFNSHLKSSQNNHSNRQQTSDQNYYLTYPNNNYQVPKMNWQNNPSPNSTNTSYSANNSFNKSIMTCKNKIPKTAEIKKCEQKLAQLDKTIKIKEDENVIFFLCSNFLTP